ncbi:MAG: AAA family ATPase [Crocinitomicaceae bacterium]|nr:DNA2/NAM7 family helicase [Flavobacteriales bacterium]NQZ34368.1 AAA family ATPase [Crocinitomicaceae bacterium]
MDELHPHQKNLLNCISLDMREQEERYGAKGSEGIKQLKALGVMLHPINVIRKSFGYADYPEVLFKLPYATDTSAFRDSSAIECTIDGEESVKGILLSLDGQKGMVRLYSPDFPDWIEDRGVGLKLAPDHFTSECMKTAVKEVSERPEISQLFQQIHGNTGFGSLPDAPFQLDIKNDQLNDSQRAAVNGMLVSDGLTILHGPPGTGKTTTLIEGILQLIKVGKRILVTAPSNAAVDNVAKGLLNYGVNILRVGNTSKVDAIIFPHTLEGRMKDSKDQKEIKKLKIRSVELRKMSYQYKRHFGKAEREQRKALMLEVKRIRKEIRDIREYSAEKCFENSDVVLGTPIGIHNAVKKNSEFDIVIMDEAGQAIEPLAWVVFPFASNWVLAGDPFQLPPTVLSKQAAQKGFDISILEKCFKQCKNIHFLDTQYRMRESIAEFSNTYFYDGKLKTPPAQADNASHVLFYDTAGTGFEERAGEDGRSLTNEGELDIIQKIIAANDWNMEEIGFISPYAGQVQLAKSVFPKTLKVSTVDSFQGQEMKIIIVSLVRSNADGNIGFLKDYRRMNVALTRAKEQLIVIGDSSTIGLDKFYDKFLKYTETIEGYQSAWEFMT